MASGRSTGRLAAGTSLRPVPVIRRTIRSSRSTRPSSRARWSPGQRGGTGGLREHAGVTSQERDGLEDLVIRHGHRATFRFPDALQAQDRVPRRADRQAVGHAGRVRHRLDALGSFSIGGHDSGRPLRLDRDQARHAGEEPGAHQVLESLRDAGQDRAVSGRHEDDIRRLGRHGGGDLERDGFLALDRERVESRVAVVPAEGVAGRHAEVEGIVVATLHSHHVRPVAQQLHQLRLRRCRRNEDDRSDAGGGSDGGQRGGGVAGGGCRDRIEAVFPGLRDDQEGGTILRGPARIPRVVLDPKPGLVQSLPQAGSGQQRRAADVQGRHRGGIREREESREEVGVGGSGLRPLPRQRVELDLEHPARRSTRPLERGARLADQERRVLGVLLAALAAAEPEAAHITSAMRAFCT